MNKLSSFGHGPILPLAKRFRPDGLIPTGSGPASERRAGQPAAATSGRRHGEMSCSVMIRRAPGLLCGSETTRNAASQEQLTTPSAVPNPRRSTLCRRSISRRKRSGRRAQSCGWTRKGMVEASSARSNAPRRAGLDPGAAGRAQRQVEVAAIVGAAGDAAAIGPDLDLGEVFGKEPFQRRPVAIQ